jgi:hypothetical protein
VLASEAMYRLTFMFLKINESSLVEKTKKNINKLPAATVKNHRRKISFFLRTMYPTFGPKEAFQKYKKYLGHDLFVKAIMAISKAGNNKGEFSNCIP